jgi:hypothetical protein
MTTPERHVPSKPDADVSRETSSEEYRPPRSPSGLSAGGRRLWREVVEAHQLDITQLVMLEEACRAKDRLDELARIIEGKGVLELMHFRIPHAFIPGLNGEVTVEVKFDQVINQANATANGMKQLLAALRLPDAEGKRPQQRGGARGAYVNGGKSDGANGTGPGGSALGGLRALKGGRSA